MLVVGLTGGIATGKSTVSALLRAHNLPIIDADVLARKVVEPGTPALAAIVRAFGRQVLRADGTLDRAALGALVFAPASASSAASPDSPNAPDSEAARRRLNAIVHPAVRREMAWAVLRCWWRGERVCVLDVPLLVEGGLWKWVGKVVVVYCSAELQLQRLMKRDGSTREDASGRLNAQLPIAEKVQYADVVLDNSGSLQDLERQVDQLVQRLEKEAGWSWRLSWLCPPLGVASAIWTIGWRALRRSQKAGARKKSGKQQQ